MNDAQTLIELLTKKEKMVAMLAPSFPIMFSYPGVITMLRELGFAGVAEVSAGAQKTNEQLNALLTANPQSKYITSPCPTVVRMVKRTMPEYAKYFTVGVDSPMAATAKLVAEKYPGYTPVFIGPCIVKKYEAREDVPELNILVLTYYELAEVFTHFGITEATNLDDHFDMAGPGPTRMYPVDGGLAISSGAMDTLPTGAVKVISGPQNNTAAIIEFVNNPNIRILDILNCPGGCISGPGIRSPLTTEERKKKITAYAHPLPNR